MFRPILLALMLHSPLVGDIVLDIAIAPLARTSNIANVTVSGRKSQASDDDVIFKAANLAIDLGNDGFGLPAGFSLASVSSMSFAANLNTATPIELARLDLNPNFDAVINLNDGSVNLNSINNVTLFELQVEIADDVAPGTVVPLAFVMQPFPGGFFAADAKTSDGDTVAVATSSGSVSVVPEPGGLLSLAAVFAGLQCWRKLRNSW